MAVGGDFADFLIAHSSGYKEKRHQKTNTPSHPRFNLETLTRKVELGRQIIAVIKEQLGDDFLKNVVSHTHVKMPNKFWKKFVEKELNLTYNTRQRLRCYRALQMAIKRSADDKITDVAVRDGHNRAAKRLRGCEYNACKGRGLGHALLQVFVDEFQVLRSRLDSCLLFPPSARSRNATGLVE